MTLSTEIRRHRRLALVLLALLGAAAVFAVGAGAVWWLSQRTI